MQRRTLLAAALSATAAGVRASPSSRCCGHIPSVEQPEAFLRHHTDFA